MTQREGQIVIRKWKRQHNRKTRFGGRLMRAYRVPGTSEAGELAALEFNLNLMVRHAPDLAN